MIDFIEVRDLSFDVVGIIDAAKSIIWHSVYYGVGDFEIYIPADPKNIAMLRVGHYLTRHNNDDVGIIESITFDFSEKSGFMMTASGQFAKSILDRRIIYNISGNTNRPTILRGKVEVAVRQVILNNAINCTFDNRRNISVLGLGALNNIPDIIVDENGNAAQKQVSYENLLTYTDAVLQEYNLSSKIILQDSLLKYVVWQGVDRSDTIVFSTDYDNLNSVNYNYNQSTLRNSALVGGEGEGLDRFYSMVTENLEGLELRELFVDASSVNRKYKEEGSEEEQQYTDEEYAAMLNQQGKRILKQNIITESLDGNLNISYGQWRYGTDFSLGDIVTVQFDLIQKYIKTRIIEATEVQDDNGYNVDIVYGT